MADRSVLVRLRADISDFQRKMATAGAGASAFAKRLEQADGRMANLVQTGLALAPALVPIGGLAVPAIAGLTAQLGFAATGAGVMLLAFQGVGDALTALNKYQLEPTAENFQAMQEKMATLGPAGRDFVRTLQELRPELQHLQDLAQAGLFPGMTEGLDEALHLMPQAEQLIGSVSTTLGKLFAEAGDNLNDPRWVKFFEFLDREAGPTLEAMGKSFGNVVEGLAAMIMAFDPLADDFTGGMLDMSRSFNQWAQGLDSSQGFQDFLDYIQKNGPEALDTLGAIGNALVALVRAAAPVGQATLPVIEHLADAFAAIADSPIGPVVIGAAAAIGVLGRSMALLKAVGLMGTAGKTGLLAQVFAVDKMRPGVAMVRDATVATRGLTVAGKAQAVAAIAQEKAVRGSFAQAAKGAGLIAGLALATSGYAEKTGLANTATFGLMGTIAGPWGAAVGAGIGLTTDLAAANNDLESAVSAVDRAMASGTMAQQQQAMRGLRSELTSANGQVEDFKDLFRLSDHDGENWFQNLGSAVKGAGIQLTGGTSDAANQLSFLREEMKGTDAVAEIFGRSVGMTGDQMRIAAGDAQALSGALAELQGWLDKRAAFRNYQAAVDELRKGLSDNAKAWDANTDAGRTNLALVDAVTTGIMQMAHTIKSPDLRADFLKGARGDLASLAKAFPGARAQIEKTIGKLDELGLTHPKPKVDADTKAADSKLKGVMSGLRKVDGSKATPKVDADPNQAKQKINAVDQWLNQLTGTTAWPKVNAETSAALGNIHAVQYALAALRDKTVTVHTVMMTSYLSKRAGIPVPGSADGGQVFGPGGPRDDLVPARLSNREWVMPVSAVEHYGSGFMAAVQQNRFADGGSPSAGARARHGFDLRGGMSTQEIRQELRDFERAMHKAGLGVGKSFDFLGKRAVSLADRYDDADKKLQEMRQRIQDVRSTARDSFNNDPFAGGLSDFDTQVGADTNDARSMRRALRKAHRRGLDGPLAGALAGSGNLLLAQEFAGLSRREIRRRERQFSARTVAQNALGRAAVDVSGLPRQVDRLVHSQDRLTRKLEHLENRIEGAVRRGAHDGTAQREHDRHRDAANRSRVH